MKVTTTPIAHRIAPVIASLGLLGLLGASVQAQAPTPTPKPARRNSLKGVGTEKIVKGTKNAGRETVSVIGNDGRKVGNAINKDGGKARKSVSKDLRKVEKAVSGQDKKKKASPKPAPTP